MELYEKIKFLRENKKISQKKMAQKLSMSLTGYAKIERGENSINFRRLEQVAKVLETDILEILLLGERNVVFFKYNAFVNPKTNDLDSSQDLAFKTCQLKSALAYKDKIIAMKNAIILAQAQEIKSLKERLAQNK